jgi:hypothetical protein
MNSRFTAKDGFFVVGILAGAGLVWLIHCRAWEYFTR